MTPARSANRRRKVSFRLSPWAEHTVERLRRRRIPAGAEPRGVTEVINEALRVYATVVDAEDKKPKP